VPGSVLETISVSCRGEAVSSKLTLAAGANYRLRASGTCVSGRFAALDAEYAFDPKDTTNKSYADQCGAGYGFVQYGIAIDDPTVDKVKTPKWGAYDPAHIYEIDFTGKGAPITLTYQDCILGDNSGSLTVEILCSDDGDAAGGSIVPVGNT